MIKWLRPYEYAKLKNTSKQNVYRWIREHKILPEDVKRETKTVERILIKYNETI